MTRSRARSSYWKLSSYNSQSIRRIKREGGSQRDIIEMDILRHCTFLPMAHVVLWASQRSSPNIYVAVCFREAAAVGPADDDKAIMEGSPEGLLLRKSCQSCGDGKCSGGLWSTWLIHSGRAASQFTTNNFLPSGELGVMRSAGSGNRYPWSMRPFLMRSLSLFALWKAEVQKPMASGFSGRWRSTHLSRLGWPSATLETSKETKTVRF